jgi:hypothetical protein
MAVVFRVAFLLLLESVLVKCPSVSDDPFYKREKAGSMTKATLKNPSDYAMGLDKMNEYYSNPRQFNDSSYGGKNNQGQVGQSEKSSAYPHSSSH